MLSSPLDQVELGRVDGQDRGQAQQRAERRHQRGVPPAPGEEVPVRGQQEHQGQQGDGELAAEQRGDPAGRRRRAPWARGRPPPAPSRRRPR